jgi:hypothetical protein
MVKVTCVYRPQCPWAAEWLKIVKKLYADSKVEEINAWKKPNEAEALINKGCQTDTQRNSAYLFGLFLDGKFVKTGPELTPTDEKARARERLESTHRHVYVESEITIAPLTSLTMEDEINLCLLAHPSAVSVSSQGYKQGKTMKTNWFKEVFSAVDPCGVVAYRRKQPIGLLEYLPSSLAKKLGFTLTDHPRVVTITCMEVALGEDRRGVYKILVSSMLGNLMRDNQGFNEIEVLAKEGDVAFDYPDNIPIMHPASLYQEMGFRKVKKWRDQVLMRYQLA